ncbi:class I SAM-dependent methyltransferase [Lapidilactobacillus wuchangensis]|uniref:class I SAM-dependent methyltransferase n=1 Tax=Lapidilactobacillus wuchangensis TaxID=2486001 RepID=UPI0013DDDBF1|nr:class I SAM-dependent methyltransferase [Lapidilactobacillus wuchangensis]
MATHLNDIKGIYQQIDEAVNLLQSALNTDYLTALSETLANLVQKTVHVENEAPNHETVTKLQQLYREIQWTKLTAEQRLSLGQLLVFRRQQVDKPQANFQATPSAVGILISLVTTIILGRERTSLQITDPVVGTGSLLLTVGQQLRQTYPELTLTGLDNNDELLSLAASWADFLDDSLTLVHQDAITPWLTEQKPDLVIADLPVGYYPVDSRAAEFELHAKSGHSFAHYLLLEQSIEALPNDGWGIFMVPANLFESTGAVELLHWLTKHAFLQMSLSLPTTAFQNGAADKAIIVLQKHGGRAKQAKEVLIANVPDMNQIDAMRRFSQQMQLWATENL